MATTYTGVVSNKRLVDWSMRALHAMSEADKWSGEFNRLKEYIQHSKKFQEAPEYNRRKFLEESWDLQDAARKYTWFKGEAERLHNAVIAQHALRQMMGQTPADTV